MSALPHSVLLGAGHPRAHVSYKGCISPKEVSPGEGGILQRTRCMSPQRSHVLDLGV